ncbi:MAG: ABC transporter permease [Hyphomonadaceae bacterium]
MPYMNIHHQPVPFALRYVSSLLSYQPLCWKLVGSDLRNRFRRTYLGLLWAFIQPLAFALMIAFVWGAMHKDLGYWGYALYLLSGITVFEVFSASIAGGQDVLINSAGYLRQAQIPFFIFQLRAVLTTMTFFLFEMSAVFIFAIATGNLPAPGPHLLLLPLFLVFMLLFSTGAVVLMSIIGTYFRDVKHIATLGLRALMLLSPVMLPREMFREPQLQFMEFFNPLVPMLDMFRAPAIYGQGWDMQSVIVLSIWIVGIWAAAIIASVAVGRRVMFAI